MNTIIQANNISKMYQKQVALKPSSFTIEEGKIYGILGRNGAGKTTLLNILCNYITPSSGEVLIFGQRFDRSMLNEIGMMIEGPAFYGSLSGKENLEIMQKIRKLPKQDIDEVLKQVNLLQAKDKLYKDYSLGMKQKLYLAQALMHKPKLLILDEPINGLDPISIGELRNLFHLLSKKEKTTILISSHLLKELQEVADELLILEEGSLIKKGSMQEIMKTLEPVYQLHVNDGLKTYELLQASSEIKNVTHRGNNIEIILHKDRAISTSLSTLLKENIIIYQIHQKKQDLEALFRALLKEGVL